MTHSAPDPSGVTTPPKHRRCMRRRHHIWDYARRSLTGWGIVRCLSCGEVELY